VDNTQHNNNNQRKGSNKMKKLQNLKEWQIVGIFSAVGVSVAYASVVALFAHTLDLLPVMTVCALLVAVTAVPVGVVVGMNKDAHLSRVVRGMAKQVGELRSILDFERETHEHALADLRDERYNTERLSREVEALRARVANLQLNYATDMDTLTASIEARQYEIAKLQDGAYHMAWALCEDGDLREDAFTTLKALLTTEAHKRAQAFADTEVSFYASVEHDGHEAPTEADYTASASTAFLIGTLDKAYLVGSETRYPLA
jgi:hypothetical protein